MTRDNINEVSTGCETGQKPDKKRTRRTAEEHHREASERAAAKYQQEIAREAERAAARQFQEEGIDYIEGRDTEGARRFAALVDAKREAVKSANAPSRRTGIQVLKAVRKAERTAGDGADIGGTGYTVLKIRVKPVRRLIETGKIGMEEVQAADEIVAAFEAVSSRLMVRGASLDRVDGGGGGEVPTSIRSMKMVDRFQVWSDFWSRRSKLLADPMLEVVIAAVVDERSIREIAQDVERSPDRVKRGIVAGLRDYAARAGFVSSGVRASAWLEAATKVFSSIPDALAIAIHRGRVEA